MASKDPAKRTKEARDRWERIKADPVRHAAWREYHNERMRAKVAAAKEADPEAYSAHREAQNARNRALRARIKADPVRRAAAREAGRGRDRRRRFKDRYGITLDDYDRMFAEQGGVCALCRQPERRKDRTMLSVDHDHETGEVRGLLCCRCNRSIGLIGDTATSAARVVDYLTRPRQ